MITKVIIKNYRSIVNAEVTLQPFTLIIGANGSGKSNFLQFLQDITTNFDQWNNLDNESYLVTLLDTPKHINLRQRPQELIVSTTNIDTISHATIFSIDPANIGTSEQLIHNPSVRADGSGAVRVLDALKTGDREDLFNLIECLFKKYVPEIEKLSFIPGQNTKQLQVREQHIQKPISLSQTSEGTRLVLTILTIVHQENPPKFICLEEIDRGLHPRLFQQIIELLFDIAHTKGIQIIATTHNPYLVNQFKGREEAVIVVEKEDGETQLTTLADKLDGLAVGENPLGDLWYAGFVGGVPKIGVEAG